MRSLKRIGTRIRRLGIRNKNKTENEKKFLILLFLTIPYSLVPNPSLAVPMDSSRFKIESANVEIAGGNKNSTSYKLADTVGQLAAGQYSSTGYVVKAGFQYLHSIIPFVFLSLISILLLEL